ncbi:MAG TPA: ATP-grasp domain-containing protein [Nitrososphaeraceae archaeon]|nr:ATP-grasp domain-containing protein [Nitrososphaeraceae archaeon]
MRLLEYQGKELFKEFGIQIPKSRMAFSIEEARSLLNSELAFPIVLKSQVPVGGRGKAGAIKKCKNMNEVESQFTVLQNRKIEGESPRGLLIEEVVNISKELYVSLFLNRSARCFSLIVSATGGMEIESTENRFIMDITPNDDIEDIAKRIAGIAGLGSENRQKFVEFVQKLYRLSSEKEAELVEVNPAALRTDGSIVALDSKVIIDDNALFRHTDLIKYEQATDLESLAKKNGFSFVQLQGNIAIIGNGAGLVMSTLDMVSDAGGNAGAFLDFGGSATSETIYQALTVISRVKTIQTIVVNLFGGIVRTDLVAQGILGAYSNNLIKVPLFARISGAESHKAKEILSNSKAHLFDRIEDAIHAAVQGIKSQEGKAIL